MGLFDNVIGSVRDNLAKKASSGITDTIASNAGSMFKAGMGKKCPKCKTALATPPGKFCQKCGTKLYKLCSKCNTEYLFDVAFCNSCGKKL
ncbi:MAG: zinc ribbon domain-containing protein [archaeon]